MTEEEFQEAIARALADKDLNSDPDFVTSLKEPDATENINKVDVLLLSLFLLRQEEEGEILQ